MLRIIAVAVDTVAKLESTFRTELEQLEAVPDAGWDPLQGWAAVAAGSKKFNTSQLY